MILQALNDLYPRLAADPAYEIAPPGFSPQKVSFRVILKPDGTLFAVEDARDTTPKGKKQPLLIQVPQPGKRTSGIRAQFLCDKREYVFGIGANGEQPECFAAFRKKHVALKKEIASTRYSALCRFLESWSPDRFSELNAPSDIFENFGVFQILGEKDYLHDDAGIRKWWTDKCDESDSTAPVEQCLITGDVAETIGIHPDIKGFKSSVALVGIQSNSAYESYGRAKTENCPISKAATFRYSTALNALLAGPKKRKHRISVADTTAVFWTELSVVENCLSLIFEYGSNAIEHSQDPETVDHITRVLIAVRSGSNFQNLGENLEIPFYILGLEQPNPGRFSIRFFHRCTTAELLRRLHDHQRCLSIQREWTEAKGNRLPDPEFPAIWQLLSQTARVADEIPPLLGGALARAIVEGIPYPEALYSAVLRRIRADRTVNYLRAATLKAILIRNHQLTIPTMLDTDNKQPAYLLGRLFAALEKTQEDALGPVNAGLGDKYYGSASATPASVFPRILRTYRHHLAKLPAGSKVNREKLIQEILASIEASGFPSQLNLRDQGIFAIGYYHQRRDFFPRKESAEDESALKTEI